MSSPFLIPSLMFLWTCNIGYHNEGSKIVKIFEYNRSFHYDDTTHHFVTDAFSSCLYHRYTIPKIQTTSLFVKYKHIRNKSKMCLTRITPTYQIELLIPLCLYRYSSLYHMIYIWYEVLITSEVQLNHLHNSYIDHFN